MANLAFPGGRSIAGWLSTPIGWSSSRTARWQQTRSRMVASTDADQNGAYKNGLRGARPPDRLRPLPTMRRGGDRLRMSVDRAADVHGGPVAVGRGTRWVSHRYWSKISLAFACAFAKIWDAEAKTAAASLCLNPGWFGKALKRKSPTRQRWRALMASARGAVLAPLQLAAAWWLRTCVRPSVPSCAHRRKAPPRTRLVGQCGQYHQ